MGVDFDEEEEKEEKATAAIAAVVVAVATDLRDAILRFIITIFFKFCFGPVMTDALFCLCSRNFWKLCNIILFGLRLVAEKRIQYQQ